MAKKKTDKIIEAVLFASDKPVSASTLAQVAEVTAKQIQKSVDDINNRLREEGSPITIREIAGGYEFLTLPEYAPYIKKLYRNRFMARLSRPALEVLSIIAYKQPITKQEVEVIRGVNSDGVYHTLLERKLVKIAGRKETPGRPLLYGTSRDFLQYLGINSLEDLPKIDEIKSILEKDEFVESWDERIETAKGQARFEFGDEEGTSTEQRLIEEKSDFEEQPAEEESGARDPEEINEEAEGAEGNADETEEVPDQAEGESDPGVKQQGREQEEEDFDEEDDEDEDEADDDDGEDDMDDGDEEPEDDDKN